MKFISAVLLVLAAVGVSADPQPSTGYQSNGFNCYNSGYASSIPVLSSHLQTSTVENPTVSLSSFIPPSTVSEACHCLQTLVRPQLRNDVITVPTLDRITRTVATPVVKTYNCGGSTRLTTFSLPGNIQSKTTGSSEENRGSAHSSSPSGYFSGGHNLNFLSAATAGNRATLIATPTSVFTLHASSAGGGVPDCQNAFAGNAGYSNTGRINTI